MKKPARTCIIIINRTKYEATNYLSHLKEELKKIPIVPHVLDSNEDERVNQFILEHRDVLRSAVCIISLGGDGTLLFTARQFAFAQKPIFGVNLGHFGFITEFDKNNLVPAIKQYLKNSIPIHSRMMLEITLQRKGEEIANYLALNDVVIGKSAFSRPVSISISVNKLHLVRYNADGLIIATPTGSTGYSLSAFGPILAPDIRAMVINVVCPHSLFNRPIIVSDLEIVEAQLLSTGRFAKMTVDGQESYDLEYEDIVIVKKSHLQVHTAYLSHTTFFDTLKKKFKWQQI